MNYARREQN